MAEGGGRGGGAEIWHDDKGEGGGGLVWLPPENDDVIYEQPLIDTGSKW